MHLQNWFSHPQDAIFFPNSWFLEKNASLIQHFPNVRCFTCILYFHFWNNLCPQKKVASHAKRIPNFSACISPINEENCCRFTKEVTIAAKCIFMQTRDALGGLSHKKEPAQWASSSSMPAAGVEPALPLGERDFKSRASANSAMPAGTICNPPKHGLFCCVNSSIKLPLLHHFWCSGPSGTRTQDRPVMSREL